MTFKLFSEILDIPYFNIKTSKMSRMINIYLFLII